jgi:hypothetical protein
MRRAVGLWPDEVATGLELPYLLPFLPITSGRQLETAERNQIQQTVGCDINRFQSRQLGLKRSKQRLLERLGGLVAVRLRCTTQQGCQMLIAVGDRSNVHHQGICASNQQHRRPVRLAPLVGAEVKRLKLAEPNQAGARRQRCPDSLKTLCAPQGFACTRG